MSNISRRVVGACFVVGAALGLSSGAASPAAAYWERTSGSTCQPANPGLTHTYYVQDGHNYLENRAAEAASFVCPVPDSTSMQKGAITTLQVRVANSSVASNLTAQACAWHAANNNGGSCGATVTVGPGSHTLSLSTSALADANETAYVWITLPAKNGESYSNIKYLHFGS